MMLCLLKKTYVNFIILSGGKMESRDQEIYSEIANILYCIAPEDSKIIIMKAELSLLGSNCIFKFNYYDIYNIKNWFLPDDKANQDLHKILIKLRDFYISQNQPAWIGCEFVVDVDSGKIKIEFKYDSNSNENNLK